MFSMTIPWSDHTRVLTHKHSPVIRTCTHGLMKSSKVLCRVSNCLDCNDFLTLFLQLWLEFSGPRNRQMFSLITTLRFSLLPGHSHTHVHPEHTHTHANTHTLSLSHTHTQVISLSHTHSLSHTVSHTHTHTHLCTQTRPLNPKHSFSSSSDTSC